MTVDDERCCGTGTCIIDAQGRCWCGQRWDGKKMCFPQAELPGQPAAPAADAPTERHLGPGSEG